MKMKFTKMHGAGNDFIVVDGISQQIDLTPAQWRALADRRFGIGADQILLVQKAETQQAQFRYRIFNNDGSEVEQCGNGARAFVKFVIEKGLTRDRSIEVETMKGIITLSIAEDGMITVNMREPRLSLADSAFDTAGLASRTEGVETLWQLPLPDGETVEVSVVSMGNPHAVQVVADVDTAPVAEQGPLVEGHARFANRINAPFMQIVDRHHIRLRVYERGAGETLACGSGACGAVVAGIRRGLLDSPVQVDALGGRLAIRWDGPDQPVYLSGPAVTVFDGEVDTSRF
ncbi:MAG TPA: diaminopimelate epimerase [Burkholderiaceae bacterium]